ncbi:GT2 family glycosyltransferase [Paenibacillus castaneae]|uniref:glycosyltransferase family 2 protein n=1 Tax=Paenibacillus castaneae TaxID=474957 RepID=UPI000C9CAFCF|nr:glycosyltransferase family 2 protein [Paenibacillus castaneae]NIK76924.1 GT2 family glycosyltransferase [Paenibacillus castaneae]
MRRKKSPATRLTNTSALRNQAQKRLEKYKQGHKEGYEQGLQAGRESYQAYFEGTSIIIPVCNSIEAIKICIEGIMDHTNLPYEIIVIDNGSKDGLERYLKQLDGQVRYRILDEKTSFTGAANRGFMMAKGTTILLMSHRIVPTENWLDNLLLCLHSDHRIGMVGPVSNGLSENQRVEAEFDDLEEVYEFACVNNVSDHNKWQRTSFLSKECLLFRRELLEKVGYWDEACLEGPYNELDYCHRVSLLGYILKCAGDSYVYVDKEDKLEGDSTLLYEEQLQASKQYYMEKWQQFSEAEFNEQPFSYRSEEVSRRRFGEAAFFPQEMVVKGLNGSMYWIEAGVRRPIEGQWNPSTMSINTLSQLDLWRWPMGEPILAAQLSNRLGMGNSDEVASYHGKVYEAAEGVWYYIENGEKRLIISQLAKKAWGLNDCLQISLSDAELRALPDGLPIIAPIRLFQAL